MPIEIQTASSLGLDAIDLHEFLRRCDDKVSSGVSAWLADAADDLCAFARNKDWFAQYICSRMKTGYGLEEGASILRYSDQCLVLARRPTYYVRLAAWDAPKNRGGSTTFDDNYFSYHFAHNHDFDLLTVGLLGPGYTSVNSTLGIPVQHLESGHVVPIMPAEPVTLAEGRVLLYQKWRDIHVQLPPPSFSLSLNVIVADITVPQYSFDLGKCSVLEQIGGAGKPLRTLRTLGSALGVQPKDFLAVSWE
jgi:hypothetical protein